MLQHQQKKLDDFRERAEAARLKLESYMSVPGHSQYDTEALRLKGFYQSALHLVTLYVSEINHEPGWMDRRPSAQADSLQEITKILDDAHIPGSTLSVADRIKVMLAAEHHITRLVGYISGELEVASRTMTGVPDCIKNCLSAINSGTDRTGKQLFPPLNKALETP